MHRLRNRFQYGLVRSFRIPLFALVLSWCDAVLADPSAEFYRSCAHAAVGHAFSVRHLITRREFNQRLGEGSRRAELSCAALVAKLEGVRDPTPEERLALFRAARWFGGDGDYCSAAIPFAEALPKSNPDALQIRSVCAANQKESLTLLLRSLEADPQHPRHRAGLKRLSWRVRFGIKMDVEMLLHHLNTFYEMARSSGEGASAAALIYAVALEAGNQETAEEIRARVRGDLGLDSLGFERREAALELLCDRAVFELDLENLCTGAMERLAAESAALGDPLPPDILRPLDGAIRLISDTRLPIGGGGGSEEREALAHLQTVLDSYPDHLKSSEHLRVHAEGFLEGPERIESLRRATRLDPGNVAARCGLAGTLERSAPEEAWSIYADLAARPADPSMRCDPQASLRRIEERRRAGATADEMPQGGIEEVIVN